MRSQLPVIRPMHPGDVEALWRLFHRAVHARAIRDYSAAQCAVWAPHHPTAQQRAAWRNRLLANQPWVIEWQGDAAGFADLQPDGWIDQFFVDPGVRGQRLADHLMQALLHRAEQRRLPYVQADVSLSAEAFFRRHGFALCFRQVVRREGIAFRNARMRRAFDIGDGLR
ncbi:GNAT family N-acetyltransferase [Algiphilus sp.]|uniref:GNAT family N-acetyltransferase n=1 Tax=Algiphilus sp. TaxID=1872431 RepID=UPI003B52E380